jgi:uncharacterized membrane protein YphA (DoxX/SURF4 family)
MQDVPLLSEGEKSGEVIKMKPILSHTILVLLVRIFLGGLFVVASLDKIINPGAFAASILNYKIVGPTLAMLTATVLPSLELLCGLGLILGLYPRTSALLITAMLVVFTALVLSALFRGLDISCGCFTQDPNASKIGYYKILENSGMIILGIYLLIMKDYSMTLIKLFSKHFDTTDN